MCFVKLESFVYFLTNLILQVKTPEVSKDMTLLVPGQMAPQHPTQEQTTSRRKRKASVGEVVYCFLLGLTGDCKGK